jgi:CheY-like chemotaxis protein
MRTVLIADDELVTRQVVTAALEKAGYRVLTARDGNEAWELLRRHRPPVAVLDRRMPGRTGVELVDAIRDDPELRSTYVVMFTAERREEDVVTGQAAGANRYLLKPFSMKGLVDAVAQGFALADPETPRAPTEW